MTTKFITIATTIALFSLGSCADHNHGDSSHQEIKSTSKEIAEGDESEALSLNSGQKWVVNDEMKPFVEEGEQALNKYIQSDHGDYKALSAELKNANNELISSCTMEGKSHDELHKWLHPHLELVDELTNANNQTEADKIIQRLTNSYQNYHTYFQ